MTKKSKKKKKVDYCYSSYTFLNKLQSHIHFTERSSYIKKRRSRMHSKSWFLFSSPTKVSNFISLRWKYTRAFHAFRVYTFEFPFLNCTNGISYSDQIPARVFHTMKNFQPDAFTPWPFHCLPLYTLVSMRTTFYKNAQGKRVYIYKEYTSTKINVQVWRSGRRDS